MLSFGFLMLGLAALFIAAALALLFWRDDAPPPPFDH